MANLLVNYDNKKPLILACDASPYGLGAVLSHIMEEAMTWFGQEYKYKICMYVTKYAHTTRMKKPRKSCFCECNEN